LPPFLAATTDGRDGDLSGAWSPKNPSIREWAAFEASIGNGFLARPEERQRYKLNYYRTCTPGKHELTTFFLAYYGFSRISGLIPLYTPVVNDTIDARQRDLTHTTLSLLADRWHLSDTKLLQLSGYARTYSLELKSNFGDGLIRQSEFRTVAGGNATYTQKFGDQLHRCGRVSTSAVMRRAISTTGSRLRQFSSTIESSRMIPQRSQQRVDEKITAGLSLSRGGAGKLSLDQLR
jgi:hypothetical protein